MGVINRSAGTCSERVARGRVAHWADADVTPPASTGKQLHETAIRSNVAHPAIMYQGLLSGNRGTVLYPSELYRHRGLLPPVRHYHSLSFVRKGGPWLFDRSFRDGSYVFLSLGIGLPHSPRLSVPENSF